MISKKKRQGGQGKYVNCDCRNTNFVAQQFIEVILIWYINFLFYPLNSTDFQGDLVRKMKAEKANEIEIKKAVVELKARKKALEDKV